MVQLTGMGLAHVVLTGAGWQYIVNNLKVQAQGGSSNVVFESLRRVGHGEFSAILRAIPWVTTQARIGLQIDNRFVDLKELLIRSPTMNTIEAYSYRRFSSRSALISSW